MELALITGGLAAVTGVGVIAASLVGTHRTSAEAIEYVRSLEDGGSIAAVNFDPRMADPLLVRVLRPFGNRLLSAVTALTPGHHRDQIHHQLMRAGLAGTYRAEEIVAGQIAGGLLGLLVTLLIGGLNLVSAPVALLLLFLLPAVGVALPSAWLNRRVTERRAAILSDLPDTLDLLAISVEAGVGLEGAMEVVSERFDSPLANEFARTLSEMELGLSRKDALQNLKRRTDVPELSAFVTALIQADALGMSIGRVLKVQAGEMRTKRRQWARERAAKLPVKIIFPLVMCIFPAVLVVVIAPAASEIGQALK